MNRFDVWFAETPDYTEVYDGYSGYFDVDVYEGHDWGKSEVLSLCILNYSLLLRKLQDLIHYYQMCLKILCNIPKIIRNIEK